MKRVQATQQPLVITQRGRAAAIMLSVEAYEHLADTQGLLSVLARGKREIAAGVGHGLDEVLAEADGLLAEGTARVFDSPPQDDTNSWQRWLAFAETIP